MSVPGASSLDPAPLPTKLETLGVNGLCELLHSGRPVTKGLSRLKPTVAIAGELRPAIVAVNKDVSGILVALGDEGIGSILEHLRRNCAVIVIP